MREIPLGPAQKPGVSLGAACPKVEGMWIRLILLVRTGGAYVEDSIWVIITPPLTH